MVQAERDLVYETGKHNSGVGTIYISESRAQVDKEKLCPCQQQESDHLAYKNSNCPCLGHSANPQPNHYQKRHKVPGWAKLGSYTYK